MSNAGIKLSPKHGLNPTIPVCFWCGEERNEVALLGHIGDGRKHEDFEAPMHMVIDYDAVRKMPCKHGVGCNTDGSYQQAEQCNQGRNAEGRLSHWSLRCN